MPMNITEYQLIHLTYLAYLAVYKLNVKSKNFHCYHLHNIYLRAATMRPTDKPRRLTVTSGDSPEATGNGNGTATTENAAILSHYLFDIECVCVLSSSLVYIWTTCFLACSIETIISIR